MRFLLIVLLSFFGQCIYAQTYYSKLLAKMASKLPADMLELAKAPGVHDCGMFKGNVVTICVDDAGCVRHIGYKLFAPEIKTMYPSDVYNFLERYTLEMNLESDIYEYEQKLKDDKVHVVSGSIDGSIKRINPEVAFSTDRVDDMGYSVAWNDNGNEVFNVFFPINYELLLGMPKVEIERKMHGLLSNRNENVSLASLPMPETELIGNGVYRSVPKIFYEIESLTTTTYYSASNDGGLKPIFSPLYKEYSAANLFLTDIASAKNYSLNIEQSMYGGDKEKYSVKLVDWIACCRANKLALYFAVEEDEESGLKVLVIARSADLGYNHMLSITLPNGFVQKPDMSFNAKLNAFIPTHNVKDLYGKSNPATKKKIW